MKKKYRLLVDETITVSGRTLYRIEALRDFEYVKKGDKGGYVESEDNLSHVGNCWVFGKACVSDNALVRDDALVYDDARVSGTARVLGNVCVLGNAKISNGIITNVGQE
ncbi:hypothetical protein LK429_00355 [Hoylesella buccalis]|uniref:hypothetical protein n=1 Tax=Hoylesella buccalis TaxID=28127 RepID=UPI001D151765|nr:hypothetical protein [Hoylesella buccalis]UEA63077.1 hypothetical protein LK429_00355 [Hoylesella buccalis]UWP49633.1 hypothetical protein NQ518_00760 [Hoylesella buccalis ATCC 35310]